MDIAVKSIHDASTTGSLAISADIFEAGFNEGLVHQTMVAYRAAGRAGTKAQKTRAEVRGGGRKPWKQKGTGRARAGTTRGPLWRTGGVTFAAKPRDYTKKLNKKMYRAALASVLAELNRSGRLVVVENLDLAETKTKLFKEKLARFTTTNAYIIAIETMPKNCLLSARNIPDVMLGDLAHLDFSALIHYDCILITAEALTKLQEVL